MTLRLPFSFSLSDCRFGAIVTHQSQVHCHSLLLIAHRPLCVPLTAFNTTHICTPSLSLHAQSAESEFWVLNLELESLNLDTWIWINACIESLISSTAEFSKSWYIFPGQAYLPPFPDLGDFAFWDVMGHYLLFFYQSLRV